MHLHMVPWCCIVIGSLTYHFGTKSGSFLGWLVGLNNNEIGVYGTQISSVMTPLGPKRSLPFGVIPSNPAYRPHLNALPCPL
jgi:hypothetical protein